MVSMILSWDLELKMMHGGGAILTFGDRILVAGYYYNPNGRGYYERRQSLLR